MQYFVYIVASDKGTLYVGMTNDLRRRVWEHRNGVVEGFSKKYGCHRLVYYEHGEDVYSVIEREKQIKKWSRKKKEWLIGSVNPRWRDLYGELGFS